MPEEPTEEFERRYRAVSSRDERFDGWFFTAVTSTGIYCRPSCPAMTPKRTNVRFYPSAAAAQQAGFRACLRCRPDAAPGSPEWRPRADVVARAMRLIAEGTVDRLGVAGLSSRLGYSERQLHRLLVAEVGTGAIALARAQRAQTARLLLETTDLPMANVAFAAGFASVRQFNDTVREVFARTPTVLRQGRGRRVGSPGDAGPGVVHLRLPYRRPMAAEATLAFLADRAVPGIEVAQAGRYARSLRLPHGEGAVELWAGQGCIEADVALTDLRDLTLAVSRCRQLLDLDADPVAVDGVLSADPLLEPLVTATPGRRVPGAVDGFELAVRAVLGQQVSVPGARTLAGRLVDGLGAPLDRPLFGLTHTFPDAAALAEAPPTAFAMPAVRRGAVQGLAAAVADGRLVIDPGADRTELRHQLLALPGVGDWTADYIAMRALGDPDVFLATDLGVRRGFLATSGGVADPASIARRAERWRPWRAYGMAHLWAAPLPRARRTPTSTSTRTSTRRHEPRGGKDAA